MDSSWSWVVCAVIAFSHVVAIGFSYASSVYYVEFLKVFNESSGTTSWLFSLNFGIKSFIGPLASLCNERFSTRVTMFMGGILSALGLLICVFVTEFYVVLLLFGPLSGIGFGLAYNAAVIAIREHFYEYRTLAFGISLAGGSLGHVVFLWISTLLIDHFGWRGALMISSGVTLNLTVCSMFLNKPSNEKNKIPTEMTQQQRKKRLKSWSGYYFQNAEYCVDEDVDKIEYFWNIKRLVSIQECLVAFEDYKMHTHHIDTIDNTIDNKVMKKSSINDGFILHVGGLNTECYESAIDISENVQEKHINKSPTTNPDTNGVINNGKCLQKSYSIISAKGQRCKMKTQTSMLDKKVRENVKQKYKLLYRNVYLILLLISFVMFHLGISVAYSHLLPFAESENIPSSSGLLMVSLLAGAGLIGKITLGAIAQSPWVNPIVLYIVAVFLCGVLMFLLTTFTSLVPFAVCSFLFGFFSAASSPTVNEFILVVTGPELFNFGFVQSSVFNGIGIVLGAPIAGFLLAATAYYPSSFYFGGAVTIFGALLTGNKRTPSEEVNARL